MTNVLLGGIGFMLFGIFCVLLAVQADAAIIRNVLTARAGREHDEALEAYTRGVDDGRRLEGEERDR